MFDKTPAQPHIQIGKQGINRRQAEARADHAQNGQTETTAAASADHSPGDAGSRLTFPSVSLPKLIGINQGEREKTEGQIQLARTFRLGILRGAA